ncbi:Periplasmic copper-binding protein (NosD) [uncultured archaeon]|nr:Periplasmic copper-binding protein (NosD) [uncultured archaeon]
MNKSLTIRGKSNPVIDAGGKGWPVTLSGSNTIAENVVQGNKNGIHLLYSEYNNITDNKLVRNINGITLSYSTNNTLLNNIFIDNKANITSDGKSMRDFDNESISHSGSVSHIGDAFLALFVVGSSILILFIAIIGLSAGLITRKILKQSSLSLRCTMALGFIGALLGFFLISNHANLLIDFLFAALCAAGIVILANALEHLR